MPASSRRLKEFAVEMETLGNVTAGKLWQRMLGEFLGEWERLSRTRMSAKELDSALAAFLDDLSEKPTEILARRSSTVAYARGRSASILTAKDSGRVSFVVRSEVLDSDTCEVCQKFAASPPVIEVGSEDYYSLMPPAQCLGGDNCRGLYIAIDKQFGRGG